jgi:hypothetical protein
LGGGRDDKEPAVPVAVSGFLGDVDVDVVAQARPPTSTVLKDNVIHLIVSLRSDAVSLSTPSRTMSLGMLALAHRCFKALVHGMCHGSSQ